MSESLCTRGNIDICLWSGLGCSNGARGGLLAESLCARGNIDIWWILSKRVNVSISPTREGFLIKARII